MINTNNNKNYSITVKHILESSWSDYIQINNIRPIEEKEVNKSLNCYDTKNGCFVYHCEKCDKFIFQSLGCNSRLCSCCGKRHADAWALNLSKKMLKVPHRHLVLSVASELWIYLKDWNLLKVYMDSAIATLDDYIPKSLGKEIKIGVIVILHTFGKDMKFQPHLHLIMTEGGFDLQGNFIPKIYINAEGLAACWKYHVSTNLHKAGIPFQVTNWCYQNKRFYVWVHKDGRIFHPRIIARYLGRYVRHPAIANSRIDWFNKDEMSIGFHYDDHANQRHNIVMSSNDFIKSLIGHIPPANFRLIRHYGVYSRRSKGFYKKHLQSLKEQTTLLQYGIKVVSRQLKCPCCGNNLKFVEYLTKPPPDKEKISYWIYEE